MNTSEVLNKAADLIEERGWTQGIAGMRVGGPHCLEGAIQAVMGSTRDGEPDKYNYLTAVSCPAGDAIREYLRIGECVYDYNDAVGRTAAEVIEALRACAVIEASRERESAEVSS